MALAVASNAVWKLRGRSSPPVTTSAVHYRTKGKTEWRLFGYYSSEGEGRKDGATARLSGRAPDNRLVHFTPGETAPRPGDVVIAEINPDHMKMKVIVNIFGRETPVEMDFGHVAKL